MAVTTAAVVGIGTGLASAGMSFSNAAKQKRAASRARAEQERLMKAARAKAEKDYYEGLNVPLDAFGEQFRQNIRGQQQSIQALQEGDTRNLVGGVGAVTMAGAEANEATRIGMADALYQNRKMKADAKEDIKQQLIQMDVGAAADQSQRERDAEQARAASIQQGFAGIGQAASSLGQIAPLYGKSGGSARAERLADGLDTASITSAAGGELSRAQIINTLRSQGYTGRQTRQALRDPSTFDYSIFQGMYTPPK